MGYGAMRLHPSYALLPGHMLNLIQRYIIRIERDRKARETGLM